MKNQYIKRFLSIYNAYNAYKIGVIAMEFLLGRCKTDFAKFRPKKIILIGNGAIYNCWVPLKNNLIGRCKPDSTYKEAFESADSEFQIASYLAQSVFKFHTTLYTKQESADNILREISIYKDTIDLVSKSFTLINFLIRPELNIVQQYCDSDTGIIVLNWDETFWNMINIFPNLLQMHGRCSYPDTIILPTEIASEKTNLQEIHRMVDDPVSLAALKDVHSYAYKWLTEANEVLSWGINYNIYESELNVLIESASHPYNDKITKIININPNRKTDISISRLFNFQAKKIECIL